ncbi:MAG: hypothetical protein HC905_13175 [Bacteroidales bacterium]|nr:hypothetical protein [Bacteroidales bacterium]
MRINNLVYKGILALSGIRPVTIVLSVILILNSCISSRLLEDDEYLFAGSKVEVHADTVIQGKKKLEKLLKEETYPLPNRRILGIPLKLWVYSVFGNPKKKEGNFIGNTYGERPVLMTDVPVDEVAGRSTLS